MSDLPRPDLREKAFRKYESDIARACVKSTKISRELLRIIGLAPASYVCRFRDAILGYKRYGYSSAVIPPGFDFSRLKVVETTDGGVMIYNLNAETESRELALKAADVEIEVGSPAYSDLVVMLRAGKSKEVFKVRYKTPEQYESLLSLESDDIIMITSPGNKQSDVASIRGYLSL